MSPLTKFKLLLLLILFIPLIAIIALYMYPPLAIPRHPPTSNELVLSLLSLIVAIASQELLIYVVSKKRGYRTTYRDELKRQMSVLKSAITDVSRFVLLFIISAFPLTFLATYTNLSIQLVIALLLGEVSISLPVGVEIVLSFVLLFSNIIIMHYFLGRYGSLYKLPVMFLLKTDDVKMLLQKHQNILKVFPLIIMVLMLSLIMYIVTIITLLSDLVNFPSVLSKISAGIVITLLLGYVLLNRNYENTMSLIEKIWRK